MTNEDFKLRGVKYTLQKVPFFIKATFFIKVSFL